MRGVRRAARERRALKRASLVQPPRSSRSAAAIDAALHSQSHVPSVSRNVIHSVRILPDTQDGTVPHRDRPEHVPWSGG
eukprot:2843097-Prymnesium_polylepis.1